MGQRLAFMSSMVERGKAMRAVSRRCSSGMGSSCSARCFDRTLYWLYISNDDNFSMSCTHCDTDSRLANTPAQLNDSSNPGVGCAMTGIPDDMASTATRPHDSYADGTSRIDVRR